VVDPIGRDLAPLERRVAHLLAHHHDAAGVRGVDHGIAERSAGVAAEGAGRRTGAVGTRRGDERDVDDELATCDRARAAAMALKQHRPREAARHRGVGDRTDRVVRRDRRHDPADDVVGKGCVDREDGACRNDEIAKAATGGHVDHGVQDTVPVAKVMVEGQRRPVGDPARVEGILQGAKRLVVHRPPGRRRPRGRRPRPLLPVIRVERVEPREAVGASATRRHRHTGRDLGRVHPASSPLGLFAATAGGRKWRRRPARCGRFVGPCPPRREDGGRRTPCEIRGSFAG